MLTNIPMVRLVANWFKRNFSDPEALGLFFTLLIFFLLIKFFGNLLKPILISVVLAYLLNSIVRLLENWHFPHLLAVTFVFTFFIGILFVVLFFLMPLLWKELSNFVQELPNTFNSSQKWLKEWMSHYPRLLSNDPLSHIASFLKTQSSRIGQVLLSYSLATIPGLLEAILYFILVPILVFFFLKDGKAISVWFGRFLPAHRGVTQTVWLEVNQKIGAYVKGRVLEMLIVGIVSAFVFDLLGMQYAMLLGVLVGISVFVPYIGAALVTIPILVIALTQWGISSHFAYVIIAYAIIAILDAYLLFPVLLSGTMKMHPIMVIISVLIFAGLWGFWGLFFAIPLTTLFQSVLEAWPQVKVDEPRLDNL